MDTAKLFALVIYVMGLLRSILSPERVRKFVRDRPDWQARGMAVTLGAITPFCSCSSVPLWTPTRSVAGWSSAGVSFWRAPIRNLLVTHNQAGFAASHIPGSLNPYHPAG